jgi:uncharacterized protein YraI
MREAPAARRLSRPCRLLLLLVLLTVGGLLVPGSLGVASAEVPQTNGRVETHGAALRVRAEPTTASQVAGQLPTGSRVLVRCTAKGESIECVFGTSDVWDNIGPGLWISDAFTFTGSDDPIAPPCSTGGQPEIPRPSTSHHVGLKHRRATLDWIPTPPAVGGIN